MRENRENVEVRHVKRRVSSRTAAQAVLALVLALLLSLVYAKSGNEPARSERIPERKPAARRPTSLASLPGSELRGVREALVQPAALPREPPRGTRPS